jgi:hypothetical protein
MKVRNRPITDPNRYGLVAPTTFNPTAGAAADLTLPGVRDIDATMTASLTPPATAPAGPRQAAVIFILITVALDILARGAIIPVQPGLIMSFLGGKTAPASRDRSIDRRRSVEQGARVMGRGLVPVMGSRQVSMTRLRHH